MSSIDRLVCHESAGASLLASLSGGRLVEVAVVARGQADLAGALVVGRIERFVPELDAAFVDIGTGRAGFLRMRCTRASTASGRSSRRCGT